VDTPTSGLALPHPFELLQYARVQVLSQVMVLDRIAGGLLGRRDRGIELSKLIREPHADLEGVGHPGAMRRWKWDGGCLYGRKSSDGLQVADRVLQLGVVCALLLTRSFEALGPMIACPHSVSIQAFFYSSFILLLFSFLFFFSFSLLFYFPPLISSGHFEEGIQIPASGMLNRTKT